MIGAYLMGGLGNFMFQIAAAYDLAVRNNDVCLINVENVIVVHRNIETYKDNILHNVKFTNKKFNKFYNEKKFEYHPIPYERDLMLKGYFQSEKYFDRQRILDLYKIDPTSYKFIKDNIEWLLNDECVSIHVRRGDYVRNQASHPVQSMDYYNSAISHFEPDCQFLVLSDDIEWCKKHFVDINVKFIENTPDYIDLNIMRLCKHNIIANSTFSWWAAWLNENPNKKVIAPKNWFGPKKCNYNTHDLIPESWFLI